MVINVDDNQDPLVHSTSEAPKRYVNDEKCKLRLEDGNELVDSSEIVVHGSSMKKVKSAQTSIANASTNFSVLASRSSNKVPSPLRVKSRKFNSANSATRPNKTNILWDSNTYSIRK